jgi:hypothetical protein
MKFTKKQYKFLEELFDLATDELMFNDEAKKVEKAYKLLAEIKESIK